MNQKEFINEIKSSYDKCVVLLKKKNNDYATDKDPFRNFRFSEIAGVPVEKGIMVRMLDKMSRVSNLLENGKEAQVRDESIEDTLLDICNYAAILSAYRKNSKNRQPPYVMIALRYGYQTSPRTHKQLWRWS